MRALLLILPLAALGLAGCSATGNSASVDYNLLQGGMGPTQVRALPPGKPMRCKVPINGHGLSVCEVEGITELDGLKASAITYVFRDDQLLSAKVEFSPGVYEDVAKMMDSRYQRAQVTPPGQAVWKVSNGAVISSATDLENGNVYTYWLSVDEMRKAAAGEN